MQKQLCEWCNELAVGASKERGGGGFVGGDYIRVDDNEYFVVHECDACGRFQGYSIESIEEEEPEENN